MWQQPWRFPCIALTCFLSVGLCGSALSAAGSNPVVVKKQIESRKQVQRLERTKVARTLEATKGIEKRKRIIEARKHWAAPLSKGRYAPSPYAVSVLAEIRRTNAPLPNHGGSKVFVNEPNKSGQIALPREATGVYREFYVYPKMKGKERDKERIVINKRTGAAYYTKNHYKNFVLMN